jgi:hypothetical protein
MSNPEYPAYCRHLSADNYILGSGVTISSSSEASGYADDYLLSLPLARTWRSTGITSEYFEIDLLTAKNVTMLAILNHNLSSSATITVKGGTTANPSSVTISMNYRQFDAFKLNTLNSYRYWRFTFADPANTDGFIEVGLPIIGAYTTLSFRVRYGDRFKSSFQNRRLGSYFGVPNVEKLYRQILLDELHFGPLSTTDMTTLRTLYDSLEKDYTPLFLIPDVATNDGYFGRFDRELDIAREFLPTTVLSFSEEPRGKKVA